jgi:hypothetical protein
MQRNILSVAVAAALVTLAGSASAAFTYTAANTAVVNISGSSATNTQLKLFAQKVLCDSTNQVTLINDSNNFAVVCTPKSAMSLGAGKTNIAVVKNSVGGSGQGITPEIARTTLPFLNVFSCATTCATTAAIPDFGMSDEEPAVLVAAGAASGDVSKLTSAGVNVVTFGTPVTIGLRNALQTAQIASGALPSTCTAGSETEACMPSLTKAQITSIFSGNAVDWSEFGLTNPAGDNAIYVARRVITSGTQTDARAFFLNDPCTTGAAQFVSGNNGETSTKADACNAASYGGANYYEGSGSGNVETCLTNHARNNRWAIGINSTEFPGIGAADQTAEYAIAGGTATGAKINNGDYQRHIKLDGYAPTLYNVAVGHYGNWVEATLNYNTAAGLSTPAASLKSSMDAGFNSPTVLSVINSGFNTTALLTATDANAVVGIMAPAAAAVADPTLTPSNPATKAGTKASPVNYFTRAALGTPNSCQPAVTTFATGLSM